MTWLPWVWVVLALLLGLIELSTGTFMFLLFAAAAAIAALAGFCGLGLLGQSVIFLCGLIGSIAAAPALVRRLDVATRTTDRFGVDALIDEIGMVTMVIDPLHGAGMIKVSGELWRATASVRVEVGQRVRVDAVSGTKLLVHPLPQPESESTQARLSEPVRPESAELSGEAET